MCICFDQNLLYVNAPIRACSVYMLLSGLAVCICSDQGLLCICSDQGLLCVNV